MSEQVQKIAEKILPVLQKHMATRAGLFGSVVRGELEPDSDVDVLVSLKKDIALLDFVGIKFELEDALGRRVDVVESDALKPVLRERILKEEVPIL